MNENDLLSMIGSAFSYRDLTLKETQIKARITDLLKFWAFFNI